MTSGWATRTSLASALVLVAVAVGCGEEELAASDTDTKDGGFWAEASNEEKNELVVFCRRKEERVNPKVQGVSTSDLREEIDVYYSAASNETDTVQEACASAARDVVPSSTVNAGSETVHSRRAVISGTVEGADDSQVTITDEHGRSYTANVDQAGNFQGAVKLPGKGTFDFDIEASSPTANGDQDQVTVVFERTEAEIEAAERAAAERERQRREAERLRREQERQQRIAENTFTFSGSGSKNIGTVRVQQESILEWTNNDEPGFRYILIYDDNFGISVDSQAASGDTVVPAGSYPNVNVSGGTSWTITIRPR
jgi:hypothetical protein